MRNPEAWSEWLKARLDERGWRQADLVANSGGLIKRDRASKWVRGAESPSHRLAVVTANTLGIPREEALEAAGFAVSPRSASDHEPAAFTVAAALARATDVELAEELLRRARFAAASSAAAEDAEDFPSLAAHRASRSENVSGTGEDVPEIPENVEEVWGHAAHPDTEEPIDHS